MAIILPILAFFSVVQQCERDKERYRIEHHILKPCDTDSDCAKKNPWIGPDFM